MGTLTKPNATAPRSAAATLQQQRAPVAWLPPEGITLTEWAVVGARFGAMSRLSNFLLGDWLRFANNQWGDSYKQAARITGYDVNTLYKLVSVASKVEVFLRRKTLTWSHHALIAAFDRNEQRYWLGQAEELKWTVEDLRIELRSAQRANSIAQGSSLDATAGAKDAHARPSVALETIVCPKCGEHLVAQGSAQGR